MCSRSSSSPSPGAAADASRALSSNSCAGALPRPSDTSLATSWITNLRNSLLAFNRPNGPGTRPRLGCRVKKYGVSREHSPEIAFASTSSVLCSVILINESAISSDVARFFVPSSQRTRGKSTIHPESLSRIPSSFPSRTAPDLPRQVSSWSANNPRTKLN